MKKVDFIIVGQGLAGTLLAHDLIDLNKSVAIIDKNLDGSASRVAAGLINPVGMKRCIPSNKAHIYFPKAIARYQTLEKKLDAQFFNLKSILRLFANDKVRHDWQIKFSNGDMDKYIHEFYDANNYSFLDDLFGSANVRPAAHLNVPLFLDKSRSYFEDKHILLDEQFDFKSFNSEDIIYKSIRSSAIIFCEGFRVKDNPFFCDLPLSPTKGEVMIIRIPSLSYFEKVISKGVYILPLGSHLYFVGSTYNHTDLTNNLTDEGQSFLRNKISDILSVDYEVISSVAGVRPTVKDRKPLIGLHPFHNKLGVFNGFGTRGALQGPSLSADFSLFLTSSTKDTQNAENQRIKQLF